MQYTLKSFVSFNWLKMNGTDAFPDSIADIIGIDVAYFTMKSQEGANMQRLPGLTSFSPEQILFLQAAQSFCSKISYDKAFEMQFDDHPVDTIRSMGRYQHSKKFAQAYNCKPGTRMNPIKKCSLWKLDGY